MSADNPDMAEIAKVVGMAWALLEPYDWPAIAAGLNRLDALAPFLDPTAYNRSLHNGTLRRNQQVVAAARQFVESMAAIRDEVTTS